MPSILDKITLEKGKKKWLTKRTIRIYQLQRQAIIQLYTESVVFIDFSGEQRAKEATPYSFVKITGKHGDESMAARENVVMTISVYYLLVYKYTQGLLRWTH